ncbi:MAG: serine hydrolase [Anaerolineae bacterium]|nr:serine hydrolase [Anaerolineae bacterium]
MADYEKPQTAVEIGLMQGFPPAANLTVTHANQLFGPYNRWSFQNELKLNRTADVWRGKGTVVPFDYDLQDISHVTYQNRAGMRFSFDDMVEMSHTDGIIVLHQGKVIYERYLNGMQSHTLHAWASGSKSMTGTLAAMLAHEGLFSLDDLVIKYLPELAGSGYGDATIRQVMDMTTALRFAEDELDPVSENWQYSVAMGWREKTADYSGAESGYAFLPTIQKAGEHGDHFTYLTTNSDVLAWIMKRLLNQPLADIMQERIWSKLGAERDAFWIVAPSTEETSGSGLLTTLPDMARFGQMLLQNGQFNGRQIVPAEVASDFANGASQEAFARGPAASPGNVGWSYHNQWWVTHNDYHAYMAMGYGGQLLYIAPDADLVIAKFSSYPTPTPAGNEFYSAFAAFPVLAKILATQGL